MRPATGARGAFPVPLAALALACGGGVLQAEGAKVVGEPSWGNVETLHGYDLPDGGRAWVVNETFEATNARYGPWEETGIIPDRIAPTRWDLFTEASHPALPVALELLGMP